MNRYHRIKRIIRGASLAALFSLTACSPLIVGQTSPSGSSGMTQSAPGSTGAVRTIPGSTQVGTTGPATSDADPATMPRTEPGTVPVATEPAQAVVIRRTLSNLTLSEKIRQLLLVHYEEGLSQTTAGGQYGGYLYFSDFFSEGTPQSVKKTIRSLNERSDTPFPLLHAVDEEGGSVTRISQFPQFRSARFKAPRLILKSEGLAGLVRDTTEKARFLKELGINLNLAPVADVAADPESFIYPRTLGVGGEETAQGIAAMVRAMGEEGLGSSLKHFPGYGDNVDTHQAVAVDPAGLKALDRRLVPFRAGIAAGADTLMVSHIILPVFDKKLPASLSKAVHDYIRRDLGFDGIIITDDLGMTGLTEVTREPFRAAVLAGNDLLITADPEAAVRSISQAVAQGDLSEVQLDEAVFRVLSLKARLTQ